MLPVEVLRVYVARARGTYATHAVLWSMIGGAAALVSAATISSATKFSGMAGGLAFALPVGIWMALRWRAMRKGGPLWRLLDDPRRIVWHYVRTQSVQSRGGNELRRHHDIFVADDEGERMSFRVDEDSLERANKALRTLAPHATSGWTAAHERAFELEPSALRSQDFPAPEDVLAADDASAANPYRDAPVRADPAAENAARKARRNARRHRRSRNRALAVGIPLLALTSWIAGARLEVAARVRRGEAQAAWWQAADAILAREAMALGSAPASAHVPIDPKCKGLLVGHSWAAVAYPTLGPKSIEHKEAQGSSSMSSFGAPATPWRVKTTDALATAPWRWTIVRGPGPDPVFYGWLLDEPDDDDPRVFVRVVDREGGALLCEGTVTVGWKVPLRACDDSDESKDLVRCAEAKRRDRIVEHAVEHAIRSAMWSD